MLKVSFSFILLFIFTYADVAYAQQIKLNEDGDKIVQFEDGSWRYYQIKDSIYEVAEEVDHQVLDASKRTNDYRMFQRYVVAAVAYEAEQVRKLDISTTAYHSLEDKLTSAKNSGTETAELELELEQMETDVQNDQRLVAYSRSLIRKILKIGSKERYDKLQKIYVPGLSTIKLTDEQLDETDQIVANRERSRVPLLAKVLEARKKKKRAKETDEARQTEVNVSQKNETNEEAIEAEVDDKGVEGPESKSPLSDPRNDSTSIVKAEIEISKSSGVKYQAKTDSPSNTEQITSETSRGKARLTREPIRNLDWESGVITNPPTYVCRFTHDGVDAFTQQQRRELAPEVFFYHTDDRLKPHMKEGDYVNCRGALTSISGGFRHLTLSITIASRNARREYGYIKSGSLLNIRMLDGSTVSLFSKGDELGNINASDGSTTYTVKYPIDYQKEKLLEKGEVDRVRIVWSTGYEDYEVYNIDFFQNQLSCLNQK